MACPKSNQASFTPRYNIRTSIWTTCDMACLYYGRRHLGYLSCVTEILYGRKNARLLEFRRHAECSQILSKLTEFILVWNKRETEEEHTSSYVVRRGGRNIYSTKNAKRNFQSWHRNFQIWVVPLGSNVCSVVDFRNNKQVLVERLHFCAFPEWLIQMAHINSMPFSHETYVSFIYGSKTTTTTTNNNKVMSVVMMIIFKVNEEVCTYLLHFDRWQ